MVSVLGIDLDIGHMDRAPLERCAAANGVAARSDGFISQGPYFKGNVCCSRRNVVEPIAQ